MENYAGNAGILKNELFQDFLNAKMQITVARTELKNIRMKIDGLQKLQKSYMKQIEEQMKKHSLSQVTFTSQNCPKKQDQIQVDGIGQCLEIKPIGFIHSAFKQKNATPRQPSICTLTPATIVLNKEFYTNPAHALDGLQDFSHIWLMFIFHKNDKQSYCKGKVAPPRLDGKRTGVFSTRSPHRPNPIGLSLARLIKLEGNILHLSGIDAVDGTPVIDIKPYIPAYDQPNFNLEVARNLQESTKGDEQASNNADDDLVFHYSNNQSPSLCELNEDVNFRIPNADLSTVPQSQDTDLRSNIHKMDVAIPSWIDCPPVKKLTVHWTSRAVRGFCTAGGQETASEFSKFCDESETFITITNILKEDPRSVYRRHQCTDQLYYFAFDLLHLTCWFDDSDCTVEIVKVSKLPNPKNKHE